MNEILQKAYDILEKRGWCQGVLSLPDGKVCLEGAFKAATAELVGVHNTWWEDERTREAWETLKETVRAETGYEVPFQFNDLETTTVEDVKLILKKAIGSD